MKTNHCLFIYNCRFYMKQGSYSQKKQGGKEFLTKVTENQGKSDQIWELFLWSAETCIFQTNGIF